VLVLHSAKGVIDIHGFISIDFFRIAASSISDSFDFVKKMYCFAIGIYNRRGLRQIEVVILVR